MESKPFQLHRSSVLIFAGLGLGLLAIIAFFGLPVAIPFGVVSACVLGERILPHRTDSKTAIPSDFSANRTIAFLTCALATVAVVRISCFGGMPTVMSPLPFLAVLPLFMSWPFAAIPMVSITMFFVILWPISRTYCGPIPPRATILLGIATALSAWWLIGGWSYGVQYEGLEYTAWVTIINVVCLVGLWICWAALRGKTAFGWRMAFGTLLFYWLFWFAFPYLGELP